MQIATTCLSAIIRACVQLFSPKLGTSKKLWMDIWVLKTVAYLLYYKQIRELYFQAEPYIDLGHRKVTVILVGIDELAYCCLLISFQSWVQL